MLRFNKKGRLFALSLLSFPIISVADCGSLPLPPSFLSKEYILQNELSNASESIDQYIIDMEVFETCISGTENPINTDDLENLNTRNNGHVIVSELLNKNLALVLGRYDYLLSNVEYGPLLNEDIDTATKK